MNYELLSDKIKALLPDGIDEDLTVSDLSENSPYFLTHVFENGYMLGFWLHFPWGNTRAREQGLVLITPKLKVVRKISTKTEGRSSGEFVKEWKREVREFCGKAYRLKAEYSSEQFWKMSDC